MKFSELSTQVKAACGLVAGAIVALAGMLGWAYANFTPRSEYEQHIANIACDKALDNYFLWKARAEKYPNDKEIKQQLERAQDYRTLACRKKKKG